MLRSNSKSINAVRNDDLMCTCAPDGGVIVRRVIIALRDQPTADRAESFCVFAIPDAQDFL